MIWVAAISLLVVLVGVLMVSRAPSSPAASAGMTVATVGAVCLGISFLAWAFG